MPVTAKFSVNLSAASTQIVSVAYATKDGTAIAGVNYQATSGTLVFPPGTTSLPVPVTIYDEPEGSPDVTFELVLSAPINATFTDGTGQCTITLGAPVADTYANRFKTLYGLVKNKDNGYFGPTTGANAQTIPYHCVEKLMVEAPDYGHETTSEAASYLVKLEAWAIAVMGSADGYASVWNMIESSFIPSATNQPMGAYTPNSPAAFQPEENTPNQYPVQTNAGSITAGADPLYTALVGTYGVETMYLMHWLYDVDGDFGFKNGDGTTTQVAINSFSRGMQESVWLAIQHGEWENFQNGGGQYGYLDIYAQNSPLFPSQTGTYAKQWRYTNAPDAEVRAIASAYLASQHASAAGLNVATYDAKAKKMGDYLRYSLYDKYFRPIGVASGKTYDGAGCHYLVGWYVSWGGEIPASGAKPSWAFRIGSSETHFGYNGVDAAYAMATKGGAYSPTTAGAGDQWGNSLARQLEMIRWLQTSAGPIAGGVSNSWYGRYEVPTDGRQNALFYGMYYTYSPVWHNPPSNNWAGYQYWGLERLAATYVQCASKTDSFNTDLQTKLGAILDRFVNWVLDNSTYTAGQTFKIPTTLSWVSPTAATGTTTTANVDGNYEYIPNTSWDGTGDYDAFWKADSVPNTSLQVAITDTNLDVGLGGSCAQLLLQYVKSKLLMGGALTDTIPLGSHTVQQAFTLAKTIIDVLWSSNKDTIGITREETRADYSAFNTPVYVPPTFSGTMPNGDKIANGSTTFISIRSFMKQYDGWDQVQAYLAGGSAPVFTYHRFWEQCDVASALAMMATYFPDQTPG